MYIVYGSSYLLPVYYTYCQHMVSKILRYLLMTYMYIINTYITKYLGMKRSEISVLILSNLVPVQWNIILLLFEIYIL